MGRARADTSSADCSLLIWVEGIVLAPCFCLCLKFSIIKSFFFFFNVGGERMKKWKTVIIVGKHMEGGSLYDALWYMFENFHNENFEMF